MASSLPKATSTTCNAAAKNASNSSIAVMAGSLAAAPARHETMPSARRHPYAYAREPAYLVRCDHVGWYARAREYLPRHLSVDRVVRFPQIDKAHIQGDFPLPSELLQPAHDEPTHRSLIVRGGSRTTICSSGSFPSISQVVLRGGRR